MTGQPTTASPVTAGRDLDDVLRAASQAFRSWSSATVEERAAVLAAGAAGLEKARVILVRIASQETHLLDGRLNAELTRTIFQLRLLGDEIRRGDVLDVRLDHADPDWPMGAARPDLRRMRIPLGPVLVFAASNFPFAFSVAGGDTASALAAGCPVVVKAHPGHPRLSRKVHGVLSEAFSDAGAPSGLLGLVEGEECGVAALRSPYIAAAAFTGSIRGGRTLFDIASSRPTPIPFFGELGSVNPVVVTPQAADDASIAEGFIDSFTLGSGQFCTKPGMLIAPRGSGVVQALHGADLPAGAPMLNERIKSGFDQSSTRLAQSSEVTRVAGSEARGGDLVAQPTLYRADARAVIANPTLQEECFGPAALIVEYDDEAEVLELAAGLPGQLTATIWGTPLSDVKELVEVLVEKAGRLLWNQWPTGVSVTHAQQHGGPYPATTAAGSTSVGTAAIERFLRPVAYQNFPTELLPPALRDDNPANVPQRRS